MIYVLTVLWCIPSPVLWFLNAEAWVIGHAAAGVEFPLVLATCAAAGQVATFSALYFGGDAILKRVPRLRAKLERFDVERYRAAGYPILVAAAVIGLPPLVLLAVVARTLHYRFVPFLVLCVSGRVLRFAVLAM